MKAVVERKSAELMRVPKTIPDIAVQKRQSHPTFFDPRLPSMPTFQSNPLNSSPLQRRVKRHPALFGLPFILIMVGASFGLQSFTQTRYDLQDKKIRQASSHYVYHTCAHRRPCILHSCLKKKLSDWTSRRKSLTSEKSIMCVCWFSTVSRGPSQMLRRN